jgi:hypothetical protein
VLAVVWRWKGMWIKVWIAGRAPVDNRGDKHQDLIQFARAFPCLPRSSPPNIDVGKRMANPRVRCAAAQEVPLHNTPLLTAPTAHHLFG